MVARVANGGPVRRFVFTWQAEEFCFSMEARHDSSGSDESVERLRRELKRLREEVRRLNDRLGSAGQLEREAIIMERDRTVARKLQESLSPVWPGEFEGIEFAAHFRPGARVGGDFYDIIKVSDTCVGMLVADVTGYGLSAAVIMATARLAFRTFATLASSPKAILEKTNKALLDSTLGGDHLTAFLGLLDSEMLTFQYVNASGRPPYLLREGDLTPLDTRGLFVGMFEEPGYEQKSIQLQRNDKLFLFTDGLIRGFARTDGANALSGLQDCLRENARLPVRELARRVYGQVAREPEDDVVILTVELLRRQADHKTIAIPSIPSELRRVEDTILPALAARGYGERSLFAVKLALEESVINAIKHGNQLDSTKQVTIEFSLCDDETVLSVSDEGEGFDPQAVPDPGQEEYLQSFSGRGLALMRAYMDSVEFNEKGNRVTMTKRAPWHPRKASE